MSAIPDLNPLTNTAAAEAMSDSQWVELHVPRFSKARPAYEKFSEFLEKVLQQAKRRLAPMAIVEVRCKGVPSFAEKILRKRRDYQTSDDPLPPDPPPLICWPAVSPTVTTMPSIGDVSAAPLSAALALSAWDWAALTDAWSAASWALDALLAWSWESWDWAPARLASACAAWALSEGSPWWPGSGPSSPAARPARRPR